jgi:hypothetical protein
MQSTSSSLTEDYRLLVLLGYFEEYQKGLGDAEA